MGSLDRRREGGPRGYAELVELLERRVKKKGVGEEAWVVRG